MTSDFKIDDVDLFGAFGYSVSEAYDDLLRLLPRQEPPTHVWEGDKTEFDLSSPAFEPMEIVIVGAIQATSEADFWSKWNSFKQLLTAPGERVLEVAELAQSYKFFYVSQPLSKLLTQIKGSDNIVYQVSLRLNIFDFAEEFEPGSNGGFVQIKNQDDETIATVQAPGEYQVIQLSGIRDDGSGVYENSIIDNL